MKPALTLPMYYGAHPKLLAYAERLRLNETEAEKALWNVLNKEEFKEYKFRRQHAIATFIADFYCHQLRLVIEVDGGYHLRKEQKLYDDFRDEDMAKLNIAVIRLSNEDVLKLNTELGIVLKNKLLERKRFLAERSSL